MHYRGQTSGSLFMDSGAAQRGRKAICQLAGNIVSMEVPIASKNVTHLGFAVEESLRCGFNEYFTGKLNYTLVALNPGLFQ
jgi:hypothetical protein